MATDLETSASSNFDYQNFFSAALSADMSIGDSDCFLDTIPTPTEGTLVIDWDVPAKREVIFYTSKTTSKVTCHADGRGFDSTTAVAHETGAKVIMAPIGDWFRYVQALATTSPAGWRDIGGTASWNANNGARSFDVDVDTDITGAVGEGMRIKMDRSGTPTTPTQCYDFESANVQYASITDASQTGLDITGDITMEAWINLESLTGSDQAIIAKYDTGASQRSYMLSVNTDGTLSVRYSDDGLITDYTVIDSNVTLPVGEWVHVASAVDVSATTATMYINGVSVDITNNGGTHTSIHSGSADFYIGAHTSGGAPFDGKIAMARVWNDIRTENEIKNNMTKVQDGTEAGLVGQWILDGDLTDGTSNGNDLTASGGLTAATDNPFSATEYGIITALSESGGVTTLTVFTGLDNVVPNDTLSSVEYSPMKAPHGFDTDPSRWRLEMTGSEARSTTVASWTSFVDSLTVPQGAWILTFNSGIYLTIGAAVARRGFITVSSDGSTETNPRLTGASMLPAAVDQHGSSFGVTDSVVYASQKTLLIMGKVSATGTGVEVANYGSIIPTHITATCSYV